MDHESEKTNTPVYRESAAYAHTHDELPAYRASHKANIACKEAIEQAIRENYDGSRLNSKAALSQVTEQFGTERMAYVLAATVCEKEWDARISRDNKAWAKTVPVVQDPDAWGRNRNTDFVVDQAHSGLVDLFVRAARKEMMQEKSETGRLSLRAQLAAKPPQPQRSTAAKSTKEDFEQTQAELETQLRQMQNHEKMLKRRKTQEERRARTHRLIEHGAVLESIFPAIRTLTAEETKNVLKKLSKIPAVQETMEAEKRAEDEE